MSIPEPMIQLTALAACVLLTACSTTETQSFTVTGNPNIDSAYIADDADFSQYDRLLIDEMGIYFPEGASPADDELERIRGVFRSAFQERLTGYDYTREPGPGMLRVTATLIDLRRSATGGIPDMRREIREFANPGSLLFLMELRDSGTNRVLARAGDSTAQPVFGPEGGTEWASVQSAAEDWANQFRSFLDANLGQ